MLCTLISAVVLQIPPNDVLGMDAAGKIQSSLHSNVDLYLSGAHCSVIPYEHCGLSNLALSQVRIQDRIIENGLTEEGSEEDSHGLWL